MKRSGILHGKLSQVIAELGHGQTIVIADYGLPVPKGIPFIDLAVRKNVPSMTSVLETVLHELRVEKAVVATELEATNPGLHKEICSMLGINVEQVSHDDLKAMTETASVIVRTGEWTSYANIVLFAGVVF
ncbi:D-ribose pyranase [Alicyclobacillus acidiphilus]|uniref:D-ribose pyranase n=1 Tax=Alicyclobacillus acidiphilus TaxID=182455 RepID=UPI00083610AA|nr:D-ribose pyranase [Alicyclobacillus acidiphilus]